MHTRSYISAHEPPCYNIVIIVNSAVKICTEFYAIVVTLNFVTPDQNLIPQNIFRCNLNSQITKNGKSKSICIFLL
jgi:hypothetical protein